MRRLFRTGLVALLVGWGAAPAVAQRPPGTAPVTLEEPRPAPVFPVALVPFTLGAEVCRTDDPVVSVQVYNVLAQPVATLRLRTRRAEPLDDLAIGCGSHVAVWDGTINQGTRIAPPGIYYVQLSVRGQRAVTRKLIVPQP